MKLCVFASGSSGNCSLLSSGRSNILIDAGISARRIISFLAKQQLTMDDIGGVLITHEHSDHVSGLKTLLKNHDFRLYAPRTVAHRLEGAIPEAMGRISHIPVGESFRIDELSVRAFHTPHDTDESVGYRLECGGVFALATDLGHVTEEVEAALCGADAVLLESNHDVDMLRYGSYPVYLKRRILSERGHLSNADCAALAARLAAKGTKKIILGHLSRENNSPAKAMAEARLALEGSDAELYCAPVLGELEIEFGREPCLM